MCITLCACRDGRKHGMLFFICFCGNEQPKYGKNAVLTLIKIISCLHKLFCAIIVRGENFSRKISTGKFQPENLSITKYSGLKL